MKRKRHSLEQIIRKLREAEGLLSARTADSGGGQGWRAGGQWTLAHGQPRLVGCGVGVA